MTRIELKTSAGLHLRLSVDEEALIPDLAREELVFVLAKNLEMFPEGQRRAALLVVRDLALIERENVPDLQIYFPFDECRLSPRMAPASACPGRRHLGRLERKAAA